MKPSQSIAVWLFERVGLDSALSGDLLEECTRGRSVVWYWRQVWIAVWIGTWGAIRDHKLIALRAIATGFAMEMLFLALWNKYSPLLPDWPMLSIVGSIVDFSLTLLTQAATGWVVARTHRTYPMVFVFLFLLCDLLWWAQRNLRLRKYCCDGFDSQRRISSLSRIVRDQNLHVGVGRPCWRHLRRAFLRQPFARAVITRDAQNKKIGSGAIEIRHVYTRFRTGVGITALIFKSGSGAEPPPTAAGIDPRRVIPVSRSSRRIPKANVSRCRSTAFRVPTITRKWSALR